MRVNICICCKSTELELIIDLGNQPWCNNFLTKEEIGTEEYYPLQLMACKKCHFLQLSYFVPKEKMFSKHDYVSGTTKSLKNHFKEVAEHVSEMYKISKDAFIVDIGGNDGTCLECYRELGYYDLCNIEAASNIAKLSEAKNIFTINDFFNKQLVDDCYMELSNAKIINASGVLFHLEEIHSVLKGVNKLLDDDGVFVVQFMYVLDMIKNETFDMIYHEHLYYYTLKTLSNLLYSYGLGIEHCYHSDIHSGSMIAYIRKINDKFRRTHDAKLLFDEEYKYMGLNYNVKYKRFAKNIESKKNRLRNYLKSLESEFKIYALGAPAKGNTLMNYFGIGEYINKIHEINELKIGKFTPHTHLPIEKENLDDLPDYYLLLSHNFSDEILTKFKDKNVKIIIPFPEIKIL